MCYNRKYQSVKEVLPLKIVVMSDSHGNAEAVRRIVQMHGDAELLIHLGDGEREVSLTVEEFPMLIHKLRFLKGNCDYGHMIEPTYQQLIQTLPYGYRIFASHGDQFQVKYGTSRIIHEARQAQADILLYGHTHTRENRYEDGLYIINPGSIGCPRDGFPPSYAVISVTENGILVNLVNL